jgi:hypothetical protein
VTNQTLRTIKPATDQETSDLLAVLSANQPAPFDEYDIVRLLIYRRAIRADVFNEGVSWKTLHFA